MNHRCAVTYDLYLAAWSYITADQRRALVDRSLSERIVLANPQRHEVGKAAVIEHLEGFQHRTPGGSFRMNNMVGWAEHALAEWQLVDVQGQPGFSGYDVVTLDQAVSFPTSCSSATSRRKSSHDNAVIRSRSS
jgi:hypothetical protein